MKKYFLILLNSLIFANANQAQTRGTKIGYIDMEYILQNVPNYTEAQNQLEGKTQKWKQEIELKKLEINKLKEVLKSEKALLTKSLIEERETEITFLEAETLDYQQKRFGPNGDLVIQKTVLIKPIQDQVFTAIQDIAEAKKYDFIFDKTSDLTILFADKRFDISDQVLRVINRSEKREQLTKKQLKEEEAKENKEDAAANQSPELAERQKALDERKIARDQAIADRKLLQEENKKEAEAKKLQIIADKAAKNSGVSTETSKTTENGINTEKEAAIAAAKETKQKQTDERARVLEERKQIIEDRKIEAEQKRQQILDEREAKKSALIPLSSKTTETAVGSEKEAAITAKAEAKQKQTEERTKVLEDRKKEAEEKRKQILEERKAKKTGTIPVITKKEEAAKPAIIENTLTEPLKLSSEEVKQKQIENQAKTLADRKKVIEDRKKAAEEKRKKILEDRDTAKKLKEETLKTTK